MELLNCPFCGSVPIVAEHAPKVNGEYQWMIACENPHCNFNPSAHGFVSSKYAIKAWNTRTPDKSTTSSSVVYESTTPHARLILDEE